MKPLKFLAIVSATLVATVAAGAVSQAQAPPPNPVLYLTGHERYTTTAGASTRYRYDVLNKGVYPAALFAPAPGLPPCGANTKSSRSWVDFFDKTGRRIHGFCALGGPADLGSIWFAVPEGQVPPSWVYIEINDRQTNAKYRSNLADTTP